MTDNAGALVVAKHVLVSAYLGIFAVSVTIAVTSFIMRGEAMSGTITEVLQSLASLARWVAGLCMVACVMTLPLVASAVAVALAFDKSIRRHPGLWSMAAPVIVWLLGSVMIALVSWHSDMISLATGMWLILSDRESLLLLLGAIPSAVIFYLLNRPKRRPAET